MHGDYLFLMQLQSVLDKIGHHTPQMMMPDEAAEMYSVMNRIRPKTVLELGFFRGTSTCVMAGALEDIHLDFHITTVDKEDTKKRAKDPSIHDRLDAIGLHDHVTVKYEFRCYTWALMKFLKENPRPQFDFIYLDGAHRWMPDAGAFMLSEKLLKVGGYIMLDDLYFRMSDVARRRGFVSDWPDEEVHLPHVQFIWDLLAKEHRNLSEYEILNNGKWGLCKKVRNL